MFLTLSVTAEMLSTFTAHLTGPTTPQPAARLLQSHVAEVETGANRMALVRPDEAP